ncbi:MAG: DUF6345 domain-containing protein [Planctomycetota bacterium]|jgi:hypothetical protein
MIVIRNSLIVCFVVVLAFLFYPAITSAYEVSAAGAHSIPNTHPDARGFYDRINTFPNWYKRYYREDLHCRERQYKRSDLGGANNWFIDNCDIHYLVGHGATRWDAYYGKDLTAAIFEDGGSLLPSEARGAWGEIDLEWIGFRNCQLLNDVSMEYWAKAMNGVRLILGFKTNCSTHDDFGKIWAQKMGSRKKYGKTKTYIYPGQTITQAWFGATDATQPGGTTARVLAEMHHCFNEHLWGNGSTYDQDPYPNPQKFHWDHTVPYPPHERVKTLSRMKVYEIVPRDVNEAYVRQIGSGFGLAAEDVVQMCDSLVMADLSDSNNPKILEVSRITGHFSYHEDGKLFVADMNVGHYPPGDAAEVAGAFLTEYGLLPADAGAEVSVGYDTIIEKDLDTGAVLQTFYQNTNVAYARKIPADEAGTMVSVAGAGARMNVYIAKDESVIGARSNWRSIQTRSDIAVNDAAATWSFFDTYGNKVAIEPVLVEYDEATTDPATAIQLYYEYSSHKRQTELIPCWMFEVEYYLDEKLVLTADTFIPAAQRYLPPVVEIIKPAEFKTFNYGDIVNFDCQVEAGLGTPAYRYDWESGVDGLLSKQKAFQTDQLSVLCPDESLDCSPLPHAITVTVTDDNGFQATDTIQITVKGPCDECSDRADLDHGGTVDMIDLAHWANRYLHQIGHGEQ